MARPLMQILSGRRRFLQALAAMPLAACVSQRPAGRQNFTPSGEPLRRVQVSADRVVRVVTGLRPFRPAGFVVRAEPFGSKLLVHNYGHGGGGVTLSWGTSQLALELALQSEHRQAAVIGCGAVGLATARLLQRHGWDVAIYAKDLPPATTSNIAGAQWSPASVFDKSVVSDAHLDELAIAMRHSYREFQNLVGAHYGVRWISNYLLSDKPADVSDMRLRYPDMFPELRELSPRQHPFPVSHALHFDTMFIEPPVYLPAMMRDVRAAGSRIEVREFDDAAELHTLKEPVIFNCSGLGTRTLFGDDELIPVKGQLVVLKPQDDINYLMISNGIYMFPRSDGVLLGGTFDRNVYSLDADPGATRSILARHASFFRNMQDPWARPWETSATTNLES
ncbi:MAG: FAD-dependent oxidoreductase [Woeseia sp.]